MKIFSTVNTASDREAVELYKQRHKRCPVIFPWTWHYKLWWSLTVFAALLALFLETYQVAFSPGGLVTTNDARLEYTLLAIFGLDILVNFNLAYYNCAGQIVFSRQKIARNYVRNGMFWIDLIGVFPFYIVALEITGQMGQSNELTHKLAFLRLIKVVRLHRVPAFFSILKYSSKISLMTLTLVRDLSAVLVWTHIWSCVMFYIARESAFDEDNSWLGSQVEGMSPFERYVTSFYWSVVTFTTVGYGDFSPSSSAEMIAGSIYMIFNVVIMAWVIGSITLLIVKSDEKTGVYREALQVLNKYASLHGFDKDLTKRLRTQLKLDFDNREVQDEQVLHFFPAGVRRKVLRRLYLPDLLESKLMRGTRQQFVDAFLGACTVEIFSPGEELLQRNSVPTDLYLLLEGKLEVSTQSALDKSVMSSETLDSSVADEDWSTRSGSITGGKRGYVKRGEFINEIGFFTESLQMETVRTKTVCKVLTMSKANYRDLANDYPGSAGRLLANLLSKVDDQNNRVSSHINLDVEAVVNPQVRVYNTAAAVQDLIRLYISKQQDDQTTRFCFAASRGDTATITVMCEQGFDPNSSDYDKRTALMVASMKGNVDTVVKLLSYHADPNLTDMHGTSALYEATKNNHEDVASVLIEYGGHLSMSESQAASTLCQAVYEGDILLLKRLICAQIQVNASDYDKRTAAHIAASESNCLALKILVEAGADLNMRDRWGNTAEDEAKRARASAVLEFLDSLDPPRK